MNADRLCRLCDYLEEKIVPLDDWRDYFNLHHWATKGWLEKKCGTTACAVGWSTNIFKDEGLYLTQSGNTVDDFEIIYNRVTKFGLVYETYMSWEAIDKFFDLEQEEAEYLFADWNYDDAFDVPPHVVVDRIRRFVYNGGKDF